MKEKKKKVNLTLIKYISGFFIAFIGLASTYFGIGKNLFGSYIILGSAMTYLGSGIIIATFLTTTVFKKKVFDERMLQADNKANGIAWWFIYSSLSIILYFDYVKPINVQLGSFLLYYLATISLIRFVSYKILLRIS